MHPRAAAGVEGLTESFVPDHQSEWPIASPLEESIRIHLLREALIDIDASACFNAKSEKEDAL